VDQVWPVGTDTVLAMGEFHITGKKPNGEPIEGGGRWTGVYVREAGNLKIGMISSFPKAPPPKD